jgi:predicted proteasome-type protease
MTYCLAMRLDEGLVFMSDTRTNAGIDNISSYRKLHVLRPAPDRVFVLQSAGNLAVASMEVGDSRGAVDRRQALQCGVRSMVVVPVQEAG